MACRPRPPPIYPSSAPPDIQSFPSPLRHHRRTPSVHREIRVRGPSASDTACGLTALDRKRLMRAPSIPTRTPRAVHTITSTSTSSRTKSAAARMAPSTWPRTSSAPNMCVLSLKKCNKPLTLSRLSRRSPRHGSENGPSPISSATARGSLAASTGQASALPIPPSWASPTSEPRRPRTLSF